MNEAITGLQQIITYIVMALGGSAALTVCIVKWGSKVIAEIIYKKIGHNFSIELEQYKQELQQQTNRANALLDRIQHISEAQFDKEFEIYIGVWERLTNCHQAYEKLIKNYIGEPTGTSNDLLHQINEDLGVFFQVLEQYKIYVHKYAPFYRKDFYDAFSNIENVYFQQINVLKNYTTIVALQPDDQKILCQYANEIELQSTAVRENMRKYLQSLRKGLLLLPDEEEMICR